MESIHANTNSLDALVRDAGLEVELHDVFHVQQLTRGTELEPMVGADMVTVDPGKTSQIHRHNIAETVLFVMGGRGFVHIEGVDHEVAAGDRIRIRPGEFHGVRTTDSPLWFLSVQSPPILEEATGAYDLEPLRPSALN